MTSAAVESSLVEFHGEGIEELIGGFLLLIDFMHVFLKDKG